MKKIALDGDFNFTEKQLGRLNAVGQVEKLGSAASADEWLKNVQGYDVICTWGDHVLENLSKLENVLVTYPYTELGSFDSAALAQKNIFVAITHGAATESLLWSGRCSLSCRSTVSSQSSCARPSSTLLPQLTA